MKISYQTEKAYLMEDSIGKFWVPKKMCLRLEGEIVLADIYEVKYIERFPVEIEGEDIDFGEPIVKVCKNEDLSGIPMEVLEKIFVPSDDVEYYLGDVRDGYEGAYAEWCSNQLPF